MTNICLKNIFKRPSSHCSVRTLLAGCYLFLFFISSALAQRASPDDIHGSSEYASGSRVNELLGFIPLIGIGFLIYCFFKYQEARKYIAVLAIILIVSYHLGSSALNSKNAILGLLVVCGVLWFGFKVLRAMFDSDREEKPTVNCLDLNRNHEVKKPKITKDNEPAADVLESNKTKSTITLRSVVPPAIPLIIKNNRLYSNRPLRPDASPNVKSLHSAATQGHAEEQFELGSRYESADGIETNNLEAAFWYLLAAKQGHIKARMRLAYFFEHGMGVWMNEEISKQLLADSKNDTNSMPDYSKIAHLISQEQDFEDRAKSLRT